MMRSYLLQLLLVPLAALLLAGEAGAQMPYQTAEPSMTPKRREVHYYGMRSYPFGKIPQNARLGAILQTRLKLPSYGGGSRAIQSVNAWKQIGPDKVGGRVRSVVAHPTDGRTVWIGTADGGVWKSSDRGESWRPLMDDANAIAMGAVAVDPGDTNILYAATGEMSSNVDAYNGAGVMKSVDGGATWRPVGLTTVGAFSRIIVHPRDGRLVLAGATKNNGGFYRSTDGGNTWSRTFTTPVSDVTIDPNDAARVWIGTMGRGIFRSTDGGASFTEANNGIGEAGHKLERISVQAAPSRPSTLFALSYETDSDNDYTRIYRSTDAGASWLPVYNGADFFGFQGWYNNVIAVKPDDPDMVLAGGLDLLRTTDGGGKWTRLRGFNTGVHDDQHAIAFDPSNPARLYLGNDGGMYRSDDAGAGYARISNGLAITQFYALAVNPLDPAVTYGGTQDNGTVSNHSPTFGEIQHGDGFFVAVDHQTPSTIYAEDGDGSFITRYESGSPTIIMQGIDPEDEAAWSAPLVIDPLRAEILWHGRGRIYRTTNRGDQWQAVSEPFAGECTALGVSPKTSGVVFAGSNRGELKVTRDGGEQWTDRTGAPGLPNRAVTDFAMSRNHDETAYVSLSGFYSGHVFRTTDGGATWSDISGGLPDIPVNALALHPEDENIIYAGTDIGMFITTDGGANWASYNQGLPRVVIADLQVHEGAGVLRLASHGRSMWEIPLEKPTLPPSITSPAGGEVWMGGTSHLISWAGFDDPAGVKLEYSIDGGEWRELGRGLAGGTFLWKVGDTVSIAARVRVSSMGSPQIAAISRTFTLTRYAIGGTITASNAAGAPYGLAFDGRHLWTADFGGNTLRRYDPATLEFAGSVEIGGAVGEPGLFTDMAYVPERGRFYLHKLNSASGSSPGGWLYEVDSLGNVVGRWPSPCGYPTGLAWVREPGGASFLLASDRDGAQRIHLLDTTNPEFPALTLERARPMPFGPRGATHAPGRGLFYQTLTEFVDGDLRSSHAEKLTIDQAQTPACVIPLASPLSSSGYINARGIELDPADSTLWISDANGSIYRIVSCDSRGPGSLPGGVEMPEVPAGTSLRPNAPNPFTVTTTIGFAIRSAAHLRLVVYDAAGRTVATLADGRFDAGEHEVIFRPDGLPSGVYGYNLLFDNGASVTRRMIHLR